MAPAKDLLPDVLPTERLNARGMPSGDLRVELRRINNAGNILTVLVAVLQSIGVVAAAGYINTWWSYLLAFVLMTRGHVALNILGHESAHRLLFSNQKANDLVGRWVLGYPSLQATMAYRRSHFAHHRDEMGPEEPDFSLYAGYPIPKDSWHRKLTRDAVGISAYKNLAALFGAAKRGAREAHQILAVQAAMLIVSVAVARPLMYVVWIVSWSTVWKVNNRLRAIAEHGGMGRSKDRRLTTHVIRQSRLARFWMVPYNTGWHLAHHADMGVPWRNLPRLHRELVASGWVVPELEFPSYRAFWKACSAGAPREEGQRGPEPTGRSSFLDFQDQQPAS